MVGWRSVGISKLRTARSRLYRSQILQVNTRWNSYLFEKKIEKKGHGERLKNEYSLDRSRRDLHNTFHSTALKSQNSQRPGSSAFCGGRLTTGHNGPRKGPQTHRVAAAKIVELFITEILIKIAWPLRKDDTHKSRRVHNFFLTFALRALT